MRPFLAFADRFVSRPQIDNVYREGSRIRLEFRDGPRYAAVQFWAADPVAAARIVSCLPTARTVEVEAPERGPRPPRRQVGLRGIAVIAAAVLVLFTGALGWIVHRSHPPGRQRQAAEAPAIRQQTASATRTVQPDVDLDALRDEWSRMEDANRALELQFRVALTALEDGTLASAGFSFGLENWLLPQWQNEERQLRSSPPSDPRRLELRRLELAAAKDWEAALRVYVIGLREANPATVLQAFRLIGMAEQAEREAQQLVDRASLSPSPAPGHTNDQPARRSPSR